MKKLKIAIVGCGRISVSYADSFRRLADEIELVYAVDKVPEKAKKFADEFGCAWTTDFDEILDKDELAAELIKNMSGRYGKRLEERYGVTLVENTAGDGEDTKKAWEILREIARARSCLLKGSELDTKKAAGFLLDDFRSGKLGRVTLEVPEV